MTAFDAVYHWYSNRLFGFVIRYIKQKEDAEGIVQEVFLKIWESRDKINLHSSFDSFIFTIAYNTTINLLRKRINEQKYRAKLNSIQPIANADQIIDDIHFKELNGKILSLLNELTPRQKEIFLLSREEGLTHQEIADALNISVNTIKNHLVKTLAVFKISFR